MEELNANRLHVYQGGVYLEVDVSILKCDFCSTLKPFPLLPYFCYKHMLEMKEKSLKTIGPEAVLVSGDLFV